MDVKHKPSITKGIRFSIDLDGLEVAHAYLYLLNNDHHEQPFGLMEDVFVDESQRSNGLGSRLVAEVVAAAVEAKCYKLIGTSIHSDARVHDLCRRIGFIAHGREFRMEL